MWMRLPVSRGVLMQCLCVVLVVRGLAQARSLPEGGERQAVCGSDDFLRLQEMCRKENDDMLSAEKMVDDGMLCKKLVDLFYCVAGHVPLCFHNLTTIYRSYFHSPHNCALSPQEIMSLQNLTAHTARKQGQQDEVDVEVDIIVPLSTPSPGDHSSSSEEEEEDVEETEEGQGMRHEEHSGSDDHTGSGASKLHHCTTPVVVMTWLGVTSRLFLS